MPSDTVAAVAPASYPSLRVDTSNSTPDWTFFSYPSSSLSHTFTTYTPKIRQRHFSVGSYYDHRSSAVSLHPTHPLYLLTSAPVSPLTSTSTDLTYRRRHPSPISYGAATFSALRRVNPFFDNYSSPRSRIDVEHEGASPAPPPPPPPPAPESKPVNRSDRIELKMIEGSVLEIAATKTPFAITTTPSASPTIRRTDASPSKDESRSCTCSCCID